jgi:signal peptidase II
VTAGFLTTVKRRVLLLALAVFVFDQWTKWLVETRVPLHSSQEIIPGLLHLSHVRNSGVAFGLFATLGATWGAWIVTGAVSIVLAGVIWFFRRTSDQEPLLLTALGLVLGGAVGNLLDRITTGAVTDFVGVFIGSYRWPDFNVADSAISIGICLLVLDMFRSPGTALAPSPES